MKRIRECMRKVFRMGDWQAVLVIVSATILLGVSATQLDPSSIPAILVDAYATFAFIVLILKIREWLSRLNNLLRARHPAYDRFWNYRVAAMNRKGWGTKVIYLILRTLTILCGIAMLLAGEINYFLLSLLTLVLFTLPDIIQDRFALRLPSTLEVIIYCFIFAAEILGEVNNFYGLIPGWDTILHTLNGFLCAAIGFAMVDMLNRHSQRIHLSPLYLAITAFCFSMTIGVLWEFIEFFSDQLFSVDMQKDTLVPVVKSILINPEGTNVPVILRSIQQTIIEYGEGERFIVQGGYLDVGIVDTMKDLFVNFVGAVVFSAFGFFYVKQRDEDRHGFAERFIPIVEKDGDA